MRRVGILLALLLFAACHDETVAPVRHPLPVIDFAFAAANRHNVLSAIVVVRLHDSDSIAVQYRRAGSTGIDGQTPAVLVAGDSAQIPVLGLFAGQHYTFTPIAYGRGGKGVGDPLEFTTDTLPSDLPRYRASGAGSPGYVVIGANPYGVVIDNTGRVVWYHRFPGGLGLNFMAQPNGRYVARPPTPTPNDIEPWIELDVLGNTTRTLTCARGLQPRLHDLIALPDGSYWILCDEARTLDLTELGMPEARVVGTAVQHISESGNLLFHWSPFDHFTITADDLSDRIGGSINWTHGNAIDLDSDGNLLVSFRNLDEVTKINTRTGYVMWRLGGRNNDFKLIGTSPPSFVRQHGIRVDGSGIVLLDNLGDASETRVEHYDIDPFTMTARLTGWVTSSPGVLTQIGGSVQRLGWRHVLVSFGTAGRVEEHSYYYGRVWQIEGNAGYVFRAQRIASLYAPGIGSSR